MSTKKNIIAFGPDMGQTNVFMRSLDHDAQDRMAFTLFLIQKNMICAWREKVQNTNT